MQDNGIIFYRRFLNGDEGGLEDLIALYQRGLLRFIYGYVHDVALAEDILTDVFLTLYYKRSFKDRDGTGLKTYLYKIARNKALNAIRKRNRRKEISLDALAEQGTNGEAETEAQAFLYGEALSPDKALERGERAKALYAALNKLHADYRQALILRYYDNAEPETIAKIMKKNTKQVYNLLARAKAALKEELQSEGIDYENI